MTNPYKTISDPTDHSKTIIITLFFTIFIAVTYGFGRYLFSVIVPDMKADIGFDYLVVGIITGSAQLAYLAAALSSGILTPRLGAGRIILGSVFICGLCLILLGFAKNIWVIGGLLIILGSCAAFVWVPMVAVVSHYIPFQHRSKVLGLMSSGTSYGVFINGLIAPFFITHYHWSYVWFAVGIATLLITVLAFFSLASTGIFSMSEMPSKKTLKPQNFSLKKNKEIISRTNIIIWLLLFFCGLSCTPFQTYLVPFIRDELMFPVEAAGRIWSIIGFVGMGSGFAIGALSDKTGIRFALTITGSLLVLAAILICLHTTFYHLIIAGIAFGLAFYAIFGLVPAYISKTTAIEQSTIVFGMGNVMLGFGSMIGDFVSGLLKTTTGTFFWTYVCIATIAVIMVVLSWLLPNEKTFLKAKTVDFEFS
ncbi:MAG: MFS transporter [Proteobacteria bacterium]|nr:MFS transporter [Pseudomonadota bacterium]MBU1585806.1 MFS transporter [Pseudomonadota bacterium]MBU2456170.1 MFS transporter [Pseudomonadota bacterium]MBU2627299.1 MFS transporter [Pseudomonadota bacterium]